MNWRRMFRDHAVDERSRKRAELMELHAESGRTVAKLERASAEQRQIADAVRNTVLALRGGSE